MMEVFCTGGKEFDKWNLNLELYSSSSLQLSTSKELSELSKFNKKNLKKIHKPYC